MAKTRCTAVSQMAVPKKTWQKQRNFSAGRPKNVCLLTQFAMEDWIVEMGTIFVLLFSFSGICWKTQCLNNSNRKNLMISNDYLLVLIKINKTLAFALFVNSHNNNEKIFFSFSRYSYLLLQYFCLSCKPKCQAFYCKLIFNRFYRTSENQLIYLQNLAIWLTVVSPSKA